MLSYEMTAHACPPGDEDNELVQLLGSASEKAFNDLANLAALICGSSMGLVTLLGERWQYHKGLYGFDKDRVPAGQGFCRYTVREAGVLAVPDATLDPRFADNALVKRAPGIRAYAGARITAPSGAPVGAICVVDTVPRDLSRRQAQALQHLATQATALIELRVRKQQLKHMTDTLAQLLTENKEGA